MEALYSTLAHASGGGRDGQVRLDDDTLEFNTRPPKELGGSGEGANPEQLFALGYSACFLGAFHAAGKQLEKDTKEAQVSTTVNLGKREAGGFEIEVTHDVHAPNLSKEDAEQVAKVAHEDICPYSHATRGNVDVTINIVE
ncbi:organic hydroperoxide resistance protein [Humidisolicoccus flavus]|uniref:organic hydroperoxide resistance protein n=1 Tax=Humidisolicoccus flavus TaxID=3111414 RepID=UPI003254A74F